jgi:hypothetical protein
VSGGHVVLEAISCFVAQYRVPLARLASTHDLQAFCINEGRDVRMYGERVRAQDSRAHGWYRRLTSIFYFSCQGLMYRRI